MIRVQVHVLLNPDPGQALLNPDPGPGFAKSRSNSGLDPGFAKSGSNADQV